MAFLTIIVKSLFEDFISRRGREDRRGILLNSSLRSPRPLREIFPALQKSLI